MNAVFRLLDRLIGWRTLLIWMALIFALSSIPNNFNAAEDTLPIDKAVHATEFGVLALMIAWLAPGFRVEKRDARATRS